MKSFYQLYDQINGEMYKDIPPPTRYQMASYLDAITTSPLNGSEDDSTYQLRPITTDDMKSYAADDVVNWYKKHGRNSTRLGPPMSDAAFKRHYGQTW